MLVRNSIIYILARVLPGVLGIGTTAILTRVLDPGLYGIYGLMLVVMMLISNVGFDWLGPSFLRFYPARRSEPETFATFVHLFTLMMFISAVAVALIWGGGGFVLNDAPIYLLGLVLAWCYSWFELASQFEIANLRPLRYLRMTLSRAALILAGASGAAWMTHDPMWTAALTGVGMLGGAVQGSYWNQRIALHYFKRELALEVVGFGLPVAISLTLLGLVNNGTRTQLDLLDSAEALGLYTAAYVLVQNSLVFIAGGIASAGYSLAVQALEGSVPGATRQMLANGTLLLAVVAPLCLGVALTRHGFTSIVLGREFRSTAVALTPWMAAAAFFSCIRAYYFDFAFHLGRRPILQVWVMAGAAVSALGLGFLLIPRMGSIGAAISVTVAMMIACFHSALAGRRIFRLTIPFGAIVRIMLCCGLMALIVLSIPARGTTGFLLQVFLGALGYGCAAIVLNVLDLRMRAALFLGLHLRR